jgi:hypothetical protein
MDIAFGSDRDVAPAKRVARFFREAGMLLDLAHLCRVPLDLFALYVCNPYFIRHGKQQ